MILCLQVNQRMAVSVSCLCFLPLNAKIDLSWLVPKECQSWSIWCPWILYQWNWPRCMDSKTLHYSVSCCFWRDSVLTCQEISWPMRGCASYCHEQYKGQIRPRYVLRSLLCLGCGPKLYLYSLAPWIGAPAKRRTCFLSALRSYSYREASCHGPITEREK